VLQCTGNLHHCELSVLDDDAWPMIVKHEEGKDRSFHWKFLEAGSDLKCEQ
jgi:hypothetical protein